MYCWELSNLVDLGALGLRPSGRKLFEFYSNSDFNLTRVFGYAKNKNNKWDKLYVSARFDNPVRYCYIKKRCNYTFQAGVCITNFKFNMDIS